MYPPKNIPGNNYLTETLPDELGLLKQLTSLNLSGGFLKGSIPTTLGMLQELGKFNFVPILVTLSQLFTGFCILYDYLYIIVINIIFEDGECNNI